MPESKQGPAERIAEIELKIVLCSEMVDCVMKTILEGAKLKRGLYDTIDGLRAEKQALTDKTSEEQLELDGLGDETTSH